MISIQQAAGNTFCTWLQALMPDVKISSSWPSPDRKLPAKAITLITAGARRDMPLQRNQIKSTNVGSNQTNTVWQVAACTQPLQLDVWAHSNIVRDDILARLDTFLHYGEGSLTGNTNADPVGASVLLYVGEGWDNFDTISDFYFSDPDTDDSPEMAAQDIYRATFRGEANFMLAIAKASPRIIQNNFPIFLDGSTTSGL